MTITLDFMRTTTRKMTARYTSTQMQDSQIDQYLNLFMTLMLPLHFKNMKLTKPYVFNTVPNVDTYQFIYEANPVNEAGQTEKVSPGNIQISPPVYCQGYILRYSQDKMTFYNRWPNLSVNQIINTGGKAANVAYTGTIPSTPFYRAQLDIFGNVTEPMVIISAYDSSGDVTSGFNYAITDVPQPNSDVGNLFDAQNNNVGTVNYITGAYSFIPANSTVIPASATIYAAVVPYQASRPTDVLFYNQQIIFRPCPMQVYQVEFQISQQPLQMLLDNSGPQLNEWYLFICSGAAKLIYTDFPDEEGMAYVMPIFQEQLELAQRRTLRQLSSQRASTIFSQPGRPLATWFMGTEYSGNTG
jgi:hypothetical protein